MTLSGKRVVIIGGSSGIGLETARLAIAEGSFVTIAGRSKDRLEKAAKELASERLRSVVADLADESTIQSLLADESRVDHIFVPAGELRPGGGDALTSDIDGLRSILEIRLLGTRDRSVLCIVYMNILGADIFAPLAHHWTAIRYRRRPGHREGAIVLDGELKL